MRGRVLHEASGVSAVLKLFLVVTIVVNDAQLADGEEKSFVWSCFVSQLIR